MSQRISPERAAEVMEQFRNRRFLVLGDIMLDQYVHGAVSRISPEAPVPVVHVERSEERLGGAANVANNLAALGAEVWLCGLVGDDVHGSSLREKLEARSIRTEHLIQHPTRPTTRKVRIIAHQQQIVRVDHEVDEPIEEDVEQQIGALARRIVPTIDGVILSDYGKGIVTENLIRQVVAASVGGQFVAVDPKVKHFSLYRGVSLVTPNVLEAGQAAGEKVTDDESLERVARRLLELLPGTSLLITRGEQGMSLFEPARESTHIPTVARHVYDVTGAGDTVIATYALAFTAGSTSREAAVLANHAAGEVIEEVGAAPITVDRLRRSLSGSD